MPIANQKLFKILLTALIVIAMCHVGNASAALSVSTNNINLTVGTSQVFSISGGTGFYRISSSSNDIATASFSGSTGALGAVQGIALGDAVITIGDSSGASVTINVQVSGITLSSTSVTLSPMESGTVTVLTGSDFYNVVTNNGQVATASVSNDTITITGGTAGTAFITVSDSNFDSVVITVTVGLGFSLTPESVTVAPGGTANVTPSVSDGSYTVSSSDSLVATASVSNNIVVVEGVALGTATITVQNSSGVTAEISVTVEGSSNVSLTMEMQLGIEESETISLAGSSGFYQVDIANTAIASVTFVGDEATVSGIAPGTTTIIIEDNSGSMITINVQVSEITLALTSVSLLPQESETISVLSGSSFYNIITSNAQVAFASVSNGIITVTGVSAGTATITITDSNTDSATVEVTVGAIFSVDPSSVTLDIGQTTAAVISDDTGFYTVTSSDPGIATASISGTSIIITGIALGTSTITVQDSGGSIVTFTATVTVPVNSTVNVNIQESEVVFFAGGAGTYQVDIADPAIASVVLDGDSAVITGLGAGKTTVTIGDDQGYSVAFDVVIPLPAPVVSVTVTGNIVRLSWDPIADADSYIVYYAPSDASGNIDLANIGFSNIGNVEPLLVNLPSGLHFFAALQAVDAINPEVSSPASNIVEFIVY